MYPLRPTIRDQLKVRPRVLVFCIVALATLLMDPVFGDSGQTEAVRYHVVYDDISNHVNQLPDGDLSVELPGSDQGNNGHGNNGHGNNQDGVDSSNPGQGHGGPNGGQDDSCSGSGDCIDDES